MADVGNDALNLLIKSGSRTSALLILLLILEAEAGAEVEGAAEGEETGREGPEAREEEASEDVEAAEGPGPAEEEASEDVEATEGPGAPEEEPSEGVEAGGRGLIGRLPMAFNDGLAELFSLSLLPPFKFLFFLK